LLPFEERKVTATFLPSAPKDDLKGLIIAVEGGVSQIGNLDIVGINRGAREGLVEGNIMAIYRKGELVRDEMTNELVQLPDVRAGLLMVFRTFSKMSYGIVLESKEPLSVGDKVRNP
jgi:hypothetical protein